ncbi:hypothetical protein [Mycoplasma sp. P36-A1]|uniref:hypothetical protein n=1 Tax=Mycoplasma sp. P36-A1 TaxID=3252900 RepID=UPI003C2F6216
MKLIEVETKDQIADVMVGFILDKTDDLKENEYLKVGIGHGINIEALIKLLKVQLENEQLNSKQVVFYALNNFINEQPNTGFNKYYQDLEPFQIEYLNENNNQIDLDIVIVEMNKKGDITINYKDIAFEDKLQLLNIEDVKTDLSSLNDNKYEKIFDIGYANILNAKEIYVLASEDGIDETIKEFFEGYESTEIMVSNLFTHKNVTVISDEQSTRLLD